MIDARGLTLLLWIFVDCWFWSDFPSEYTYIDEYFQIVTIKLFGN